MERSACSALNPRERRNPVRYAVDGYGVLSCVIGGMIDRMRTSVMSESISRWAALQDWDMEFTLDIRFIRDILEQEHALARDEIRDLGVLRAFDNSGGKASESLAT